MSKRIYDKVCLVAIGIGGTVLFKYGLFVLVTQS